MRRFAPLAVLAALTAGCGGAERQTQEQGPTIDLRTLATVPDGPSYDPVEEALDRAQPPVTPTGFIPGTQAPFPRGAYTFNNGWQDFRGKRLVQVFAGEFYGDPSRGVIVVQEHRRSGDGGWSFIGPGSEYPAPDGMGSLTLRRAAGATLYFTSNDGRSGSFSIAARDYRPR